MRVFRLGRRAHLSDLDGAGARAYGGRWNRKGVAVIYTSENRSLATVEYLVHVPPQRGPTDLGIAILDIPDTIAPREVAASDLPADWRASPAPPELAAIGTKWALSLASLLLRVPSAVVQDEHNILINPSHPQITQVRIAAIEPYEFDERLLS